jgi:hypothetical protein
MSFEGYCWRIKLCDLAISTIPISYWAELTESGYSLRLVGTSNYNPERESRLAPDNPQSLTYLQYLNSFLVVIKQSNVFFSNPDRVIVSVDWYREGVE